MTITPAQRRFKRLAGNVNQFLITIMVGLDAVRTGEAKLGSTFSTSWAPRDVARSADRSKEFAIKAMIAWLVDALDAYVRALNRKPFLVQNEEFRQGLDSAGSSVQARVDQLGIHLALDEGHAYALCVVAIVWRNRLVHSDAENEVPADIATLLQAEGETIGLAYQGLDVLLLLTDVAAGNSPKFKEATALVRAAHTFVEEADKAILERLDLDAYLEEALQVYVSGDPGRRAANVWGKDEERKLNSIRQIAHQVGLSPAEDSSIPLLQDRSLALLAGLNPEGAKQRFAS